MPQVDALLRLLVAAPPRSADIVGRVTFDGLSMEQLAERYGVDIPQAQRLLFRSFLDVLSGGHQRVPDDDEPAAIDEMLGMSGTASPQASIGPQVHRLWQELTQHREALRTRLNERAAAHAADPARHREEWLRKVAIVVILAVSAYLYWREKHRPLPPAHPRLQKIEK